MLFWNLENRWEKSLLNGDIMRNDYLKNKVAVVSGSSMGIGKAIAWELAQLGVKVVLNGRDSERLENAKIEFLDKGFKVDTFVADIRLQDECRFLVDEVISVHGQLDILVNNAGISSRGSIENSAEKNFTILSETNFTGTAHLSKYAIPHLKWHRPRFQRPFASNFMIMVFM